MALYCAKLGGQLRSLAKAHARRMLMAANGSIESYVRFPMVSHRLSVCKSTSIGA
jgi:hypothetical protein